MLVPDQRSRSFRAVSGLMIRIAKYATAPTINAFDREAEQKERQPDETAENRKYKTEREDTEHHQHAGHQYCLEHGSFLQNGGCTHYVVTLLEVSVVPLTADVIVVGSGVIGLCCATSIATSGKSVLLIGEHRN
jgi:Glycine/D-amino acid oxidases (deaminating)